eukprot:scaffold2740_cov130-Isochrysis_galbana.AAC.9
MTGRIWPAIWSAMPRDLTGGLSALSHGPSSMRPYSPAADPLPSHHPSVACTFGPTPLHRFSFHFCTARGRVVSCIGQSHASPQPLALPSSRQRSLFQAPPMRHPGSPYRPPPPPPHPAVEPRHSGVRDAPHRSATHPTACAPHEPRRRFCRPAQVGEWSRARTAGAWQIVWQHPLAFGASAILGLAASFMTFLVIKVSGGRA